MLCLIVARWSKSWITRAPQLTLPPSLSHWGTLHSVRVHYCGAHTSFPHTSSVCRTLIRNKRLPAVNLWCMMTRNSIYPNSRHYDFHTLTYIVPSSPMCPTVSVGYCLLVLPLPLPPSPPLLLPLSYTHRTLGAAANKTVKENYIREYEETKANSGMLVVNL